MNYDMSLENPRNKNRMIDFMLSLYFFIAFFEPYLNGVLGSITKYYIVVVMFVILCHNRTIRIGTGQICFLCWLAYKMLSILWTSNTEVVRLHFFSQIGMISLLVILMSIRFTKDEVERFINIELFGSTAIAILSLFFAKSYLGYVDARRVLVIFGQYCDPNNIAAFLCIGSIISLYYLLTKQSKRILFACIYAVNVFACFQTGSRTGLITIVTASIFAFFALSSRGNIYKKLKIVVTFIVLLGLVVVICKYILPDMIFERLFVFGDYKGGIDRVYIWSKVWNLCKEGMHLLIGAGWGAYHGYEGMNVSVHNTFLSMLCDVGIIGCTLFFSPIITKVGFCMKTKNYFPVLLLLVSFVPAFFIESINKRYFWNAIMLFFIYVNAFEDEIKKHS